MPPIQVDFVREIRASLQRLVDGGEFKNLHVRPIGKNQAPEFPYLYLHRGPGASVPRSRPGYSQWVVSGSVWIIIAANQVDESGVEDLAMLVNKVHSQIVTDASNFTNKSITIDEIGEPRDPEVSALIVDLLGTVLEIKYSGVDTYVVQV